MKSSEIIRLVQKDALASELDDPHQFAEDIALVIKNAFSPNAIRLIPDSF